MTEKREVSDERATRRSADVSEPDWLPVMRKLHTARRKLGAVQKDANNTFFKSRYATLSAVLDSIEPVCEELNLEYWQWLGGEEPGQVMSLVTRLVDLDTGSHLDSVCRAQPSKDRDPQAVGSLITYLRRYGLVLAFGVRVEDDDGNGASGRSEGSQKKAGGNAGLRETLATKPKTRGGPPISPEVVAAAVEAGFGFDIEEWCREMESCESVDELDLVAGLPKKNGIELAEYHKAHGAAVYRRKKAELGADLPI